jgi:hypothetical protein
MHAGDPLDDLAAHPGLLAELQAARAAGVSWRRYTGWEPTRIAVHEYEDGRLVRSVTTTEPEWDDDQRAAVQALLRYEASLCPGCRSPWAEVTDPDNEGRYITAPAIRCHRCTALSQAQGIYQDTDHPDALHIPVEYRPPGRDVDG